MVDYIHNKTQCKPLPTELQMLIIQQALKDTPYTNLKQQEKKQILPLFQTNKTIFKISQSIIRIQLLQTVQQLKRLYPKEIELKYSEELNVQHLTVPLKFLIPNLEKINTRCIKSQLISKGYNKSEIKHFLQNENQLNNLINIINNGDFDKLTAKGFYTSDIAYFCADENQLNNLIKIINNGDFDKLTTEDFERFDIELFCKNTNQLENLIRIIDNGDFYNLTDKGFDISDIPCVCEDKKQLTTALELTQKDFNALNSKGFDSSKIASLCKDQSQLNNSIKNDNIKSPISRFNRYAW